MTEEGLLRSRIFRLAAPSEIIRVHEIPLGFEAGKANHVS
jgi:hypothetical protein